MFGTQSTFDAVCAVASRVAGRTIVPPKHVRGRYIKLFVVRAESGLVGARLGGGDNLVHIRYAMSNVQDTRLTPSFEDSIEVTNFGLCLHGSNPGARPHVPEPGFDPDYTPQLPPPDDFDLDDVIGDYTTLGAVAYPSDPAHPGFVWAPVSPASLVFIVVLTVFTGHMLQGYKTIHGLYLATGAAY